ncbi:MAG: Omp28-related outer membrane protein [bacterium]
MRRVSLVLLVIGMAGSALPGRAATRMVLGEMFTNYACPPCKPAGEELDRFAPLHPYLSVIRYHTWWPLNDDPFYLANAAENTARTNYYQPGAKFIPRLFIDGIIDGGSDYTSWEDLVSGREAVESPLNVIVDGTYDWSTRSGTVYAYIEATDTIPQADLKLHFVITECDIHFRAPNGQSVFHEVMRDMLPDADGEPVSISFPEDSVIRYRDFYLDTSWVFHNCEVVVFIQSDADTEVLQAGKWEMPIEVPGLSYVYNLIVDSLGNGDGRADPGEAVEMIVTLENDSTFLDATNVAAYITCDNPDVNVTHGTVSFPDIPSGSVADNSSDPFRFSVDAAAEPSFAYFNLDVSADPGGYTMEHRFWIILGRPDVLLVDDDSGAVYERFFVSALESLQVAHDMWDVQNDIDPPDLSSYHCIIWFTGNDSLTSLTIQEQTDLASFLDGGGNLILTGQNIGQNIDGHPFYSDYLRASLIGPVIDDYVLDGEPGDPIGNGLSLVSTGSGGAENQTSQDVVEPLSGAAVVFRYSADSVAAIRHDSGTYKVVYYAFGLEGLSRMPGYSGRDTVLARSLEWVGCPVLVGSEEEAVRRRNSMSSLRLNCRPNPFRSSLGISGVVPAGERQISLSIYDICGRLVKRILDVQPAGSRLTITGEWDGRNNQGDEARTGIYFIRLTSGAMSRTEKVVLLR